MQKPAKRTRKTRHITRQVKSLQISAAGFRIHFKLFSFSAGQLST